MTKRMLCAVILAAATTGCVGDSGSGGSTGVGSQASASEQAAACDAVEACGESRQSCDQLFEIAALDSQCAEAIETASCEDHAATEAPPFVDTCFPICSKEGDECTSDGKGVRRCTGDLDGMLRVLVAICEDVCAANGAQWAGSCGDSYMGQPSSTGGDVCWCEAPTGVQG